MGRELPLRAYELIGAGQPISDITFTHPRTYRLDPVAQPFCYPLHSAMVATQLLAWLTNQPYHLILLRLRVPTGRSLPR